MLPTPSNDFILQAINLAYNVNLNFDYGRGHGVFNFKINFKTMASCYRLTPKIPSVLFTKLCNF
jgi:hypothetical protein